MSDLSEKTRSHLNKVYSTLLASTLSCVAGMFVNKTILLTGVLLTIGIIILICYLLYIVLNKQQPEFTRIRHLLALAFFIGFVFGPLMHLIAKIHPGVLIEAGVYTASGFVSFSAVSLFSPRRSFLFLGSIIMTLTQIMIIYWLFALFSGGTLGIGFVIFGLFLTCMRVIYDTQVIVVQAEQGYFDVPSHALILFVDLF